MKWIDAYDIEKIWAGRRDCQENLPLLTRKLIRATSNSIQSIKFPSGESVLIGGWDGVLEVTEETDFLPSGISLWEFGANKDPKSKADSDFKKRTEEPQGYDPSESTFIFVTPRLWKNGEKWAKEKKAEGKWKDVRVINSELLEEWIDLAPTVGSWLAKHIGRFPDKGIQPTDDFWDEWATGEKFKLSPEILLGGRQGEERKVLELNNKSSVTAVQGLSREESLAFIISCFKNNPDKEEDFFSRSIIVENAEAFRELTVQNNPLIIIPRFEDNGVFNRAMLRGHTVIVPLGADSSSNWSHKISLPQIERESFVSSLMNIGMTKEFAEKYSKETIRNITILRRQLEFNRTLPTWATPENVAGIIPALIAGRWDENFESDKKIISQIAGIPYEDYIKKLSRWLHSSDAPIVKIGSTWRLTSPFDAWTNASINLTSTDFNLLHKSAAEILSEINPAFELEPEQRYMASIYGKNRAYSKWFREGLIQSLILTSIFGDKLSFDLPVSAELWVNQIISEFLSTSESDLWKSFEGKLPLIAEASPAAFLDAIEKHLSTDKSPVAALFDEDPGFLTSQSYHTGLLWALESLAWFPEYLSRVALILAKLSAIDPGGNLSNRPINSLSEIFKPWHFQTLASFDERMQVLNLIASKEPVITWTLLVRMLPDSLGGTAFPTHKTRWRMFELETEKKITWNEIYQTHSTVVEILLSIFDNSERKLAQLIDHSDRLSVKDRAKVLAFVEKSIPNVEHIDHLSWHECRDLLNQHRSHPDAKWALPESELPQYEKLFKTLTPDDEVAQTIWMFNDHWPNFPEGFKYDSEAYDEQEALILEKRINGLRKIYDQQGLDRIIELAKVVKEPWILGDVLAYIVNTEEEIVSLLRLLSEEDLRFIQNFIFRKSVLNDTKWIFEIFEKLKETGFPNRSLALLLVPLNQTKEIWDFVANQTDEIESEYWENLYPRFYNLDAETKEFGINKLLDHKRFISAIHVASRSVEEIQSDIIVKTLRLAATQEAKENERLEQYTVTRLFEAIDARDDVDSNELINIEWLFLPFLASYGNNRKPKKLHEELSKNPEFFMEVLKFVYKPDDESKQEELTNGLTDEQLQNRARQAYELLNSWKNIPGVDDEDVIDAEFLNSWVQTVRKLAEEYGRLEAADIYIGQVLAQYPEEKQKSWPPKEICEIIETVHSESLSNNFSSATFNKRSFSSRGPFDGGDIERSKAKYFHELAAEHRNTYPTVSKIFVNLAKGYEEDAKRMDEHAERSRLDY